MKWTGRGEIIEGTPNETVFAYQWKRVVEGLQQISLRREFCNFSDTTKKDLSWVVTCFNSVLDRN